MNRDDFDRAWARLMIRVSILLTLALLTAAALKDLTR